MFSIHTVFIKMWSNPYSNFVVAIALPGFIPSCSKLVINVRFDLVQLRYSISHFGDSSAQQLTSSASQFKMCVLKYSTCSITIRVSPI